MKSRTKIKLVFALIAVIVSVGCGPTTTSAASKDPPTVVESNTVAPVVENSSAVETVREGMLVNHATTTVGKAFEGTFQDAKWTSFETPKGVTVVEFNGTVTLYAVFGDYPLYGSMGREIVLARDRTEGVTRKFCIASLGLADTLKEINGRKAESSDVARQIDTDRTAIGHEIDECSKHAPIPVSFQFTLAADKRGFQVSYIDQRLFRGRETEAMAFIYT